MTLEQYYNAIISNILAAANLTPALVYNAVNMARREVSSSLSALLGTYAFTLTTGQGAYDTAIANTIGTNGVNAVYDVRIVQGNLRIALERIVSDSYDFTNYNGYPEQYFLMNQQINYYPIPSSPFKSEWKVAYIPADLVLGTDVEIINPIFYDPIILLATSYTAILDQNQSLSQYFRQLYSVRLSTIPKNILAR